MQASDEHLLKPQSIILGRYEVVRHLASGGMGDVYLCRTHSIMGQGTPVVIKTMRTELVQDESLLTQFLDEALVVASLNHPNLVSMIEVAEWEGGYLIAMEYIHGVDVTTVVQRAAERGLPVPPRVVASVIRDAAKGLYYAHQAKDPQGNPLMIIHRDVSPQNLMVRSDGVAKVVDFGVAAAANRLGETHGHVIKGTLQYMSPEQLRREALDALSDQWGLGTVAWEMCTSRSLFYGSPWDVHHRILEAPIPLPSSLVASIPPRLDVLVMRMLDRNRRARFADCAEVAQAMDEFLEETGGSAQQEVGDFVQSVAGDVLQQQPQEDSSGTSAVRDIQGSHRSATGATPASADWSMMGRRTERVTATMLSRPRWGQALMVLVAVLGAGMLLWALTLFAGAQ